MGRRRAREGRLTGRIGLGRFVIRSGDTACERQRAGDRGQGAPRRHTVAPSPEDLRGRLRCLGARAADHIEHRREDQAEQGYADHAEEYRRAEGLPHLRPRARRDRQRQNAEDEGEGGHQDRAQADSAGGDGGLEPAHAVIDLVLTREFDDQNSVLGSERDQHDEADLGEDVVVHAAKVDAENRGQQAHRHDQDDRERQREGLIHRRQDQKHEHDGQHEDQHAGIAGKLLLKGDVGPFIAHAGRQNLIGEMLHRRQRIAGGIARRGLAANVGAREQVVAHDAGRARILA